MNISELKVGQRVRYPRTRQTVIVHRVGEDTIDIRDLSGTVTTCYPREVEPLERVSVDEQRPAPRMPDGLMSHRDDNNPLD